MGEVTASRRGGSRAFGVGEDGLVALWIAQPSLDVWREGNAAMREKRFIRGDFDMSDALWVRCRHHDVQRVIDGHDVAHADATRRTSQGLPVTRTESLQQEKLGVTPAAQSASHA